MKINEEMTLKEKYQKLGSYSELGSFFGITRNNFCRGVKRGYFSNDAIVLVMDLMLGLTTASEIKKDFKKHAANPSGRPRKNA